MVEQVDGTQVPPHPIDLFEQLVSEVEAIVQKLETGELPLAEAIREYQRGIELIRRCNQVLDQAELQISQLRVGSSGYDKASDLLSFLNGEDENLPFS
ncbi:MAG: exodeoxyribonuclease VII small subunit [Thermomicrobium sp.]|nr:exodeoxyribonuclease VII small subunit [Thermomicrobium sp.]MDW7982198.1 exodeoxyribonuclease VII small subunit [Thermomicrobium sp.]